jgi:hypothetical protein
MAVKIGHSSIDENGRIAGGSAGDQTGKEMCTRSWYNGGWNVLLRPKSAALAEKSAVACEKGCANNKIGYDQNQRNTLNTKAKAVGYDLAKITVLCECDCSSFMHVCAIAGGARLPYNSNGATTRTMRNIFKASGEYEVLTESKYLTSDKYLKRGDILVKEGSHTVMVLSNGSAVTTTSKPTTTSQPSGVYTGNSIVEYLKSVGKASDFVSRKRYATQYGIENYTGTAAQNLKLLDLMRGGGTRYYPKYTGDSYGIDTVFRAIGVPEKFIGSWAKRKPIAQANNIEDYSGTHGQNVALIALAKVGKLRRL